MKNEFYEMYCEEVAKNEKLMIGLSTLFYTNLCLKIE